MAQSFFQHVRISGISAIVPPHEVRLADELQYFGGDIAKARRMTKMAGIDRRRIAEPGVTASDLCHQAAENLILGMKLERESIDAIIFVSQGPDYALPATACLLQHRLNLSKNCAAFDVNQGCAGYTYGLWLASSLIESHACSRVLLLVGESLARLTDEDNRIVTPLFGDCGTATLVEYIAENMPSWFMLGTDGSGAEALIVPAGRARLPLPRTAKEYAPFCERIKDPQGTPWRLVNTYMRGSDIFEFTMSVIPEHIQALLRYAGQTPDDIDRLVLHQANMQIVQAVTANAGFPPEKSSSETFSAYGNQAGASIPSAICHTLADTVRSTKVKMLLSGFGVGLSWASAILRLDNIWCSGICEFEKSADHLSPEAVLAGWQAMVKGTHV
jgi:3-oxoacyl-[acyl-carrier-protein] synthase III